MNHILIKESTYGRSLPYIRYLRLTKEIAVVFVF